MQLDLLPARADIRDVYLAEPVVAVSLSGLGRRWIEIGGRRRELSTTPAMVETCRAGYQLDRFQSEGEAGSVISIALPNHMVSRIMPAEGRAFDLRTQHEVSDPTLAEIISAMWSEAQTGSQRGALYAEGLTLALLGLLLRHRHADSREGRSVVRELSATQRNRVLEYIEAEMAGELSVERLAESVGMSAFYFARLFKTTFNQSPHAYVIEQRLQAASRLLRAAPLRSIADIASSVGFSSHAHFAEAFRRRMGATPSKWRSTGINRLS